MAQGLLASSAGPLLIYDRPLRQSDQFLDVVGLVLRNEFGQSGLSVALRLS